MSRLMSDPLAEMITGEPGSVRAYGKIVVRPSGEVDIAGKLAKTAIWGVVFSPDPWGAPGSKDDFEMWECEIIITPKRRFSSSRDGHVVPIAHSRADQMLTGNFADPDEWGDEIRCTPQTPRDQGWARSCPMKAR